MRRIPTAVVIFLPLALGVLYALAWPMLMPSPSLATVVPEDAVIVQRFRDLAALDATWFGRAPDDPVRPSERVAAARNLAGLPGLDRERPFHLVLLPRGQRPDSSLFIVPVADARVLQARFDDPSFFLDHHQVRYAQHLAVRGEWAAVAWDEDAVERLGTAGLTAASLGETMAIAVDVPGAVDVALATPGEMPWRSLLEALGFEPLSAGDPASGSPPAAAFAAGRVLRVREAWRTARLWAFLEEGRLRVDLEPAPGALADLLAAVRGSPAPQDEWLPDAPANAEAWIRAGHPSGRATLARALLDVGVAFPEALAAEGRPLGRLEVPEGSGLLLWAAPSPGKTWSWTLGLAARPGGLPDLPAFHPAFRPVAGGGEAPEGALALLRAALDDERPVPAARVLADAVGGLDVVTVGAEAEDALARFRSHVAAGNPAAPTPPAEDGFVRVATFGLAEARARALLGPALLPGGVLAALSGGAISGQVTTDGRILRLEAQRSAGPDGR